ncbi:MAG: PIG-L family deacetylase [Bacteroidetes bacterium]|nr:PIG-L family deacetylase [Bacteroidales bacterium]NJO69876.1 PIG-L family deacetylase [Bacteroidota bacterium]
MKFKTHASPKSIALIVAHPDDETLWAGGTILSHPAWKCLVICLCRKNDPDRARKFHDTMKILRCEGIMGDLDDGPEQMRLDERVVENTILSLLPPESFDVIITHNPTGEYTRHIRHEEVSKAVIKLWYAGKIKTGELRTFAYEDGNKAYYPRPVENASVYRMLTKRIWLRKLSIITETYGYETNGWEALTTPKAEAFWKFTDPADARKWIKKI